MVHAELNALLQCDVSRAHTLYCTLKPCDNCQAHIEAAGIKRVVFPPMVQLAQFLETTACVAKPSPYEAVSKRMFSSKPEQAELTLRKMFSDIASYHTTLGYPRKPKNLEDRKQMTVEIGLALHQEVAELIDSFDWKPWKDGLWDRVNTKEEMIDIFFFLGSLLELFNILPRELEEAFELKLEKNYNRIRSGYNKEMK
jgi:NTP pyrophosphatase (non-canonical NTP hydrolase)